MTTETPVPPDFYRWSLLMAAALALAPRAAQLLGQRPVTCAHYDARHADCTADCRISGCLSNNACCNSDQPDPCTIPGCGGRA